MNKDLGKYCYEIVLGNEFANKPLNVLTSHLDSVAIRDNAKNYYCEVLKQDEEYFDILWRKNVNKVIGFLTRFNLGAEYINKNRNHDAHRLISKFLKSDELSIEGICKKESITISDFEEYANVIKYTDVNLYKKFKSKVKNTDVASKYDDKEIEIQKYCYNFLKSTSWSTNKISNKFNLSSSEVRKNALLYATNVLGYSKSEFYYEKYIDGYEMKKYHNGDIFKHKNCSVDKKYYVLYEEISDTDDEKEIINIIEKYYSEYNADRISVLRRKTEDYSNMHRSNDGNDFASSLKKKIRLYTDKYIKINKEKNEKRVKTKSVKDIIFEKDRLPKIKKLFEDYLDSSYNMTGYSRKIKVSSYKMHSELMLLKKYFPDLYTKVEEKNKKMHKVYLNYAKKILIGMKDNPDFDIFDYYHITVANPEDLLNEVKDDLSSDEIRIIKPKFNDQTYSNIELNPEKLLKSDYALIGENKEEIRVSDEVKKEVYDYYIEHNFPLSYKSFFVGLRRHINGTFYDYEKNNKIKR